MVSFAGFTRKTTVEQLEDHLRACLRLAPDGAQLPPERELAKELGVNRGTLREALIGLEVDGVIVRRQGAGTYVTSQS